MNMIRWQPLHEMVSMQDWMDRFFNDRFIIPSSICGNGLDVPIDVYQTNDAVTVKATLPGTTPDDIDVSITDDTLTIKGETKSGDEVKAENYYRKERRYGSFSRSIVLPSLLKTDKAEANFEDGVLTLTIPKAEETKPKQIKIKAKDKK